MAENESLDLGKPGGQRWNHVLDAVRKKKSPSDIARQVELKLPKALRKAHKEFAEYGVTFADLMANRHDPEALNQFVRQCQMHDFANLFEQTAAISAGKTDRQFLCAYLDGVLDQVFDRITHKVVGAEWETIDGVRRTIMDVRTILECDLNRIANKLDENPTWNPTAKPRNNEQKAEDAQSLLGVSLLGDKKS